MAILWTPGEEFNYAGSFVNMLWTGEALPERIPGPYFDAIGMYFEDFDPFELLSMAARSARSEGREVRMNYFVD